MQTTGLWGSAWGQVLRLRRLRHPCQGHIRHHHGHHPCHHCCHHCHSVSSLVILASLSSYLSWPHAIITVIIIVTLFIIHVLLVILVIVIILVKATYTITRVIILIANQSLTTRTATSVIQSEALVASLQRFIRRTSWCESFKSLSPGVL